MSTSEVSEGPDNKIFRLACKLVDTASADRKLYWLPTVSELCEAVREYDKERFSVAAREREVRKAALEEAAIKALTGRTMVNFNHVPEIVRALEWVAMDIRAAKDVTP